MLGLKDRSQVEEYLYRVCEISFCESEAEDQFETTEGKVIDLCHLHYNLIASETLW